MQKEIIDQLVFYQEIDHHFYKLWFRKQKRFLKFHNTFTPISDHWYKMIVVDDMIIKIETIEDPKKCNIM